MTSSHSNPAVTTGQLARNAGVSADTIRHYEKLGLLPKSTRTGGGYRLFPADTLRRVEMIRSALSVGFSLAELAPIFAERAANGSPCRAVAKLGAEKVAALNRQIANLIQLRDWLASTVTAWDQQLRALPEGSRAHLLESLPKPDELNALITKGNHDEEAAFTVPVFRRAARPGSKSSPKSK